MVRECLLGLVLVIGFSDVAFARPVKRAALAEVCETVLSTSQARTIYKNSAPLRSGGVGTPLIGYRKEPTLIMNTNNSSRGTTAIYSAAGAKIGSCPWATAEGHPGGRYRCTMSTSSLRRAAQRSGNSPKVYFRLKNKICVEIKDAGKCYGSVKGLCNQTIR